MCNLTPPPFTAEELRCAIVSGARTAAGGEKTVQAANALTIEEQPTGYLLHLGSGNLTVHAHARCACYFRGPLEGVSSLAGLGTLVSRLVAADIVATDNRVRGTR